LKEVEEVGKNLQSFNQWAHDNYVTIRQLGSVDSAYYAFQEGEKSQAKRTQPLVIAAKYCVGMNFPFNGREDMIAALKDL